MRQELLEGDRSHARRHCLLQFGKYLFQPRIPAELSLLHKDRCKKRCYRLRIGTDVEAVARVYRDLLARFRVPAVPIAMVLPSFMTAAPIAGRPYFSQYCSSTGVRDSELFVTVFLSAIDPLGTGFGT